MIRTEPPAIWALLLVPALVVVPALGAASAPAASAQQGDAYAGTHVEFESDANSVTNYAVNDAVVVESATMLSSTDAYHEDGRHVGEDVALIGSVEGAEIAGLETSARATATVEFESGGTMEAHDNQRGVVRFSAEDSNQVVQVDVGEDAEISEEGDGRLIVETDDGAQGAFILLGSGELGANGEGQVNANLYSGSELVYRQYDEERSEDDEQAERMIEEGTATAEVYVRLAGDDGDETAADVVEYGGDTTVEVLSESRDTVEMSVERANSDGTAVLASVHDEAFDDAEDVEVTIDGEAAAKADSYGEVESAASDGEEASYYVVRSSSTEATTDVAVGVDHFSERTVELSSGDGGNATGDGPGFGALGALSALVASLAAVRLRT